MAQDPVIARPSVDGQEDIWQSERLSTIPENIKEYVQTRLDLLKLTAVEKASTTTGTITLWTIVGILGLFALTMLSMSLGFALGKALDSNALGFTIVGGIYLLIAGIVFILKKQIIINPIVNTIITSILSEDDKHDKN